MDSWWRRRAGPVLHCLCWGFWPLFTLHAPLQTGQQALCIVHLAPSLAFILPRSSRPSPSGSAPHRIASAAFRPTAPLTCCHFHARCLLLAAPSAPIRSGQPRRYAPSLPASLGFRAATPLHARCDHCPSQHPLQPDPACLDVVEPHTRPVRAASHLALTSLVLGSYSVPPLSSVASLTN
ncbi:hypothetical protein P154DRAFT_519461 [Amniculicola lignicola CBS 123094]|uniref:Secreted protein n=1 Tax=Amniculicola lignicola CBS 123094 TaxID=1392246 RepID=A0A6A5WU26_9PLEO|nr:hypothetical protein P154DRAFT_519461 [Amniculicola lignicola CBS 123094]